MKIVQQIGRSIAVICAVLFGLILMAGPLGAQAVVTEREALFVQAQGLVTSGTAKPAELQAMRDRLAAERDTLSDVVAAGSVEGQRLRAELGALGAPASDGSREAPQITKSRQDLEDAIAVAETPWRNAQAAVQESTVLIAALDARIRSQETERLLLWGLPPFSPMAWLSAGQDLRSFNSQTREQIAALLSAEGASEKLQETAPVAAVLAVMGLVLLLALQPLLTRFFTRSVSRAKSPIRRWFLLLLINLSLLVVPVLGTLALTAIPLVLDVVPMTLRGLPTTLMRAGISFVLANWIGQVIFAPVLGVHRLVNLADGPAQKALFITRMLGLTVGLAQVLTTITQNFAFEDRTVPILWLPVVALGAALLWRLAQLLRDEAQTLGAAARERVFADAGPEGGFVTLLRRVLQVVAFVIVAAALLGFMNLARAILIPTIQTLFDLGLGLFLFAVIMDVLKTVLGRNAEPRSDDASLLPIAVASVLVMAFLPLLALNWGARTSDISDAWRVLSDGVQLGGVTLSLDAVIVLIVVFAIGLFLTRWLQHLLRATVLPRTALDFGAKSALVTGVGYLGLVVTAFSAVSAAGLNLSNLAVVIGALSVGIGLGLQNIVSNFVSGIILLIERPIQEGDWIEVGAYQGIVRKISVRATRVRTFDLHEVIIPNFTLISGAVTNYSQSNRMGRVVMAVSVAYGSDLPQVMALLSDTMLGCEGVLAMPAPQVLFTAMADSALNLELRCFVADEATGTVLRSRVLLAVYLALGQAGIEIR